MTFIETYLWAFPVIMTLMTSVWTVSVSNKISFINKLAKH